MTTQTKIPTVGLRLISMLVDHFIMVFMIGICSFILALPLFFFNDKTRVNGFAILSGGLISTIIFMLFSLYFNKDVLNGRSPAKRILKLQVVDNGTKLTASPMKCLLRNLTAIIFPIEVVFILFNPSQRLGDKLANTKVVLFNELKENEPLNKKDIFKTLFIGIFAFIGFFILTILFQILTN